MTSPPTASSTPSDEAQTGGAGLTAWENVSFTIAHWATALLLACLSLSGLYRFGRVLGTLEWLINYKKRRRFTATLERTVGHRPTGAQRRRASREFFMRARCDKLFYLIIDCIPHDPAKSLLTIGNRPMLDEALDRGHGAYVALSHHGAHHVIAMLLAIAGYKTAGVRDRREGAMRRYVQGRFDRRYPEFQRMRVLFSETYPRDIYRCFKDGYLLGSAMDVSRVRDPNQKTEEVTIFGEKRQFLSGPVHIAIRCQAPVLQGFIVPVEGFHYRLDIVGMLADPLEVRDDDAAVRQAMQTYDANVESYVRASPTLLSRL
jgi:lauroyl/myristoyl acyltransferase